MAQLWGGRFTGSINELAWNFNASISFDLRFLEVDVRGSSAHAKMLAKQGIITDKERDDILRGLESILEDVKDDGKFKPMADGIEMTAVLTDSGKYVIAWDASRGYDYEKKIVTDDLKANW